jgi:hypothetical protein
MTPEERARLNRLPHWARPIALALADAWSLLTLNGAGGWKHGTTFYAPTYRCAHCGDHKREALDICTDARLRCKQEK